jgi:hypothetical protein
MNGVVKMVCKKHEWEVALAGTIWQDFDICPSRFLPAGSEFQCCREFCILRELGAVASKYDIFNLAGSLRGARKQTAWR